MKFAAALILAWLSAHGYDNVQRDAAFVLARGESRLDPYARSGHGDFGLYQWRGGRLTAMVGYVRRRLPQIRDERPDLDRAGATLIAQLEFMDLEWRAMPQSAAFFAASDRHAAFAVLCRHFARREGCR